MTLLLLLLLAPPRTVTDDVYRADFSAAGLLAEWKPYDNWGKPALERVETSPLGTGPALRVAFDDHSTLGHFDKGALLQLPQPVPWAQVDYIAARYQIDHPVANIRIFCHCDKGGWWDYTDSQPVIGGPAEVRASREDFRLAWTDKPDEPGPDRSGRITTVFVSVHNVKPPRSGEKFQLWLDDVRLGTQLLPLPDRLRLDAPPLACWPVSTQAATAVPLPVGPALISAVAQAGALRLRVAAPQPLPLTVAGRPVVLAWSAAATGQTGVGQVALSAPAGSLSVAAGEASWSGRYRVLEGLTAREALGLAYRVGSARLHLTPAAADGAIALRLFLPEPFGAMPIAASLADSYGEGQPLRAGAAQPTPGGQTTVLGLPGGAVSPGTWRLTVALGADPVRLDGLLTVPDLDREAVLRLAGVAAADAGRLSARVRGGQVEPWWTKAPLTTMPRVPDRQRVDPTAWTRIPNPVTWADLGGDFVGSVQCGISDHDLKLYFEHYDFGRWIKPHLSSFLGAGWQQQVARVAQRDLLIGSIWGYVPDAPWNGGFGDKALSKGDHDELVKLMGRHFLGHEMGEQDGRYVGSYAPRYAPADRREARKLAWDWHQRILDLHHGNMALLASLNFAPMCARMGHRIIGIEAAQGLPSDTMQWAYLRGASKQFGVLTWNCISVFNRWGYKSYTDIGADHGPDKGTSVELMKRLWYASWLYGSASNSFESAYFLKDKDAAGFPKLSPVGQAHVDAVAFAKQHRDRGVLYTPVAVMLDQDSGWVPPRHLYTSRRNLVWGNLPYERGDVATDAFFRWLWPQYEDCSYHPDERGFLCNTPFGDQFDVVMSDASAECLQRYQTVVLLGEVARDPALGQRLREFVGNGGELICDDTAFALGLQDLCGLTPQAGRRAAQRAVLLPGGEVLEEEPYSYRQVGAAGATALALSEHGDGTLWSNRAGKGRVVTCLVPRYVSSKTADPQAGVDVPLEYKLLRAFQRVLVPYFESLQLVEVDGAPVQWTVNVDRDPRRLVVGLFNQRALPAAVRVRPRHGTVGTIAPWLGEAKVEGDAVVATVPAGGVVIVEVRLGL